MKIKSRAFKDGGHIPSRYTCDGENFNPPLEIYDIPEETESLAIIVDDPDAPSKTWTHWLVWNILVNNHSIEKNNPPKNAVYGINDFERLEYDGPYPPSGTHRYFFKVYVLNRLLQLSEGATKEELMNAIEQCKIDTAELVGLYSRR
jgi:hypothetical protein